MSDALLLSELDTDPQTMGYAAAGWASTPPSESEYLAVLALLDGATRSEDQDVTGSDLFLAIRPADFLAVFDGTEEAHKEYLRWMKDLDRVPLKDAGVRTSLQTIFAGKTQTIAAIAALQTRSISRLQELGLGRVTHGDLKRLKGDI